MAISIKLTEILKIAGKFFTWPKFLIIIVALIIIIVGVVWYASLNSPSTSNSPTPTGPSSSPTQTATASPKSSSTPLGSTTPSTPTPTQSPSLTPTPTATLASTPTPTLTPSPTPTATASPTPTPTPQSITVVFNFDNATPTLSPGQGTPIDQTANGVTAHFSSPSDIPTKPAFSVQNINSLASISTVINSTNFSGLFLWPSTTNKDRLDISFSRNITRITFTFKTAEFHDPGPGGTGSPIRLTAYMNSISTAVGSPVTTNGIETPSDNYPEGTLTLNSSGHPFNMVEIDLPYIAQGASGFIIDNITVTTT